MIKTILRTEGMIAMLRIKEADLKWYLDSRRSRIERPALSGLGEIVSGISVIFTLISSSFDDGLLIDAAILEVVFWIFGLGLIVWGIYSLYAAVSKRQTVDNLFQGVAELDTHKLHVVNVVLVRQADTGKYLLVDNEAWKCEIFPSYYAQSGTYDCVREMENIRNSFFRDTGFEVQSIVCSGHMDKHIKICAGEDIPYRYEFYFYKVETAPGVRSLKRYNGKKYVWKSLDQMRRNKNIMAKNDDVVNRVAEIEGIPYN